MNKLWVLLGLTAAFGAGVASTYWWSVDDGQTVSQSATADEVYKPADLVLDVPAPTAEAAATDPLTLAQVAGIRGDFEQTVALYQLLADKTPTQLADLIDDSDRHMTGTDYRAATSIMFSRLAELAPRVAIDKALEAKNTAVTAWIAAIFQAIARQDFSYAVNQAKQLPPHLRVIAGRAILGSDSQLHADQLQMVTSELGVQAPVTLSGRDPRAVWEETKAITDRSRRWQIQSRVINSISAADPELALTLVEDIQNAQYRRAFVNQVLGTWAQMDGEAALDWLINHQESDNRRLVQSLFKGFASADLEAARRAVDRLGDDTRQAAVAAILPAWFERDALSALAWVRELPVENLDRELSNNIGFLLARNEPDLAFEWIDSLPQPQAAEATTTLISVLASTDPAGVAQRIERTGNPQRQQQMAQQLLSQWAQSAPKDAAQWLSEQNIPQSTTLYQNFVQGWARQDPDQALDFATGLQQVEHRDAALQGFLAGSLSTEEQSMEQVMAVYETIEQPTVKQQAAAFVYFHMRRTGSSRAAEFAEQNNIDTSRYR